MNNRLKATRLKYGKKQAEIAEVLGIGVSAYSMMESGQREINSSRLIALSKFYGCTTDELLGSWAYFKKQQDQSTEEE